MLDDDTTTGETPENDPENTPTGSEPSTEAPTPPDQPAETADKPARKTAAKKTAAKKATAKKTAAKKTATARTRKAAAPPTEDDSPDAAAAPDAAATAEDRTAEDQATGAQATGGQTAGGQAAGDRPDDGEQPATKPARSTARASAQKSTRRAAQKTPGAREAAATAADTAPEADPDQAGETGAETAQPGGATASAVAPLFQPPTVTTTTRRRSARKTTQPVEPADAETTDEPSAEDDEAAPGRGTGRDRQAQRSARGADTPAGTPADTTADTTAGDATSGDTGGDAVDSADSGESGDGSDSGEGGTGRRRRRRGGRRRRKNGDADGPDTDTDDEDATEAQAGDAQKTDGQKTGGQKTGGQKSGGQKSGQKSGGQQGDAPSSEDDDEGGSAGSRRRRRRRRAGDDGGEGGDDPDNTVTRVRKGRSVEDEITAVSGSTRLEAKKQRRREGREAGRRRAPIVSEAEFLARREAVDRTMAIRQHEDLTQIAVLEDKVLVEHYVARESQTSLIGNVYLGRVQNVLPSMEAAFIDIGKGRNAVLYAGEVNWSALGHKDGQPRKIESVLSSGQSILVQVTKDPVGHKGARLTSQVSLAGRFLVYVPDGTTSGISRKLPDTERGRLKTLLKEIVPDSAGVIVRTAAEGASEEELTRDVERLKARWADIEKGAKSGAGPKLLYGEPDLTLKVVRDLFTEDFAKLVIQGDEAWATVQDYVSHVAPDLEERLEKFQQEDGGADIFATYRIDEQIAKGLDRKVWLPSGGSLIIDRTEAMTVVDVNTGKFTGSGGNLEETVTKNNLEAAEEIVRQLRLRDIGGIIVVDFIDMVLESNRDLVLRRLVECLGRDRTRHQVAEVTSLGLVQMTRKRIGTGLLEAFSETCEHCQGRGLVLHDMPVEAGKADDDGRRGGRRRGRGKGDSGGSGGSQGNGGPSRAPSPKDVAAMARPENADRPAPDEPQATQETTDAAADAAVEQSVAGGPPAEQSADGAVEQRPARRRPAGRSRAEEQSQASEAPAAEAAGVQSEKAPVGAGDEPPADQHQPQPQPEPAAGQPEPEQSAPTAPPAPPKVVTRTRRRAASRPAGPPAALSATNAADSRASGSPAPDESPGGVVPSLAEAAPAGGVGSPAADGMAEPGVAAHEPGPDRAVEGEPEQPAAELHVPVKKKGSRKR